MCVYVCHHFTPSNSRLIPEVNQKLAHVGCYAQTIEVTNQFDGDVYAAAIIIYRNGVAVQPTSGSLFSGRLIPELTAAFHI